VFLFLSFLAIMPGLSPSLSAQTNPLISPGFETGDLSGWTTSYGTRSVVAATTHSGSYSGKVGYGSSIAQTVTGLSPNTTYTFTSWFKVDTAGQVVYMGVNNHGGSSTSNYNNSTTYAQKTLTFTTGATNTSANIFVYQSGSGFAYCDDLVLSDGGGVNLLANPGFETGDLSGWTTSYGTRSVAVATTHSGSYSGKVGYGSSIAQTVTGLSPNTTYTFTSWLKVDTAGQVVYMGVNNHGGSSASNYNNSTTYAQKTLTFTTGAANTSANIFVYQSGSGSAYCDDLVLSDGTSDPTGTQASRIADCLQRFGTNTFSKLYVNGYPWSWGGSQGNYDSATTARAINYITAGSGLTMNIREYHRDSVGTPAIAITPLQKTWIRDVYQATNSPFTIAIAAGGGTADIPGIADIVQDSVSSGLNYVKWVEGLNEPNMDFGWGTVPVATTATVQTALFQQVAAVSPDIVIAGPSIVFSLPYPDGSLTSYLGASQAAIQTASDAANVHVYPPKSPNADDASNRGGTLANINTGFNNVLPGPVLNTEWHPTLYSNIHKTDPAYDAYWGPIYMVSSFIDFNWEANFWFALFDYNSVSMKCGLFATSDTTPYPVANAFRALYSLTGDHGADKLTFPAGRLDVTVSGLPTAPANSPRAGGRWALFESSAHTYFLLLWNEQNDISAATVPVTVTFNAHTMAKVEEFNITSGSQAAMQTLTNTNTVTVALDTSMRLLRITY
jgi:hypothetical protein